MDIGTLFLIGFTAGLVFAVLVGIVMVKQQIERGEYKDAPKGWRRKK